MNPRKLSPVRYFQSAISLFPLLVLVCTSLVGSANAFADSIRIATYNIQYLNADDRPERLAAVRDAIDALDADVIALQEIDDRAALEAVFDPAKWFLIIDDESGNRQDLAVAVRRTLDTPNQLNADDDDFLFSFEDNTWFPVRRDVLHVQVVVPGLDQPLHVLVVHLKSRVGGRASNDYRRAGAAMRLVDVIDTRFKDQPVILLGDFNDNPDDRSMNILETGNPDAPIEIENDPGEFMRNLTEPLLAAGYVTNSLNSMRIDDETGKVIAIDTNSRNRNYDKRDTNAHTGNILFDQILTTPALTQFYVQGSTRVFDGAENIGSSDHLPVFADFDFAASDSNGDNVVRIVELLPNPSGTDAGNERVSVANFGNTAVVIDDWRISDRSQRSIALEGTLEPGEQLDYILPSGSVTLNNSGDDVFLHDAEGVEQHQVSYSRSDVDPGVPVVFENAPETDGADDDVRLVALLPNPDGTDAGNEYIVLENFSTEAASINNWFIEDRSGNRLTVTGSLSAGQRARFTIAASGSNVLTLNNAGDEIVVFDENGLERQRFAWSKSDVRSGVELIVTR